jgi:hypothetical protein
MLGYFIAIWSILRPFGIFRSNLLYFIVIWYIFPRFGILYQEKSGNPADWTDARFAFCLDNKICLIATQAKRCTRVDNDWRTAILTSRSHRATRCVCDKTAQNVAPPIFVKNKSIAFTVEKKLQKIGLLFKYENYPKKPVGQWAKIRPIWSPWSRR